MHGHCVDWTRMRGNTRRGCETLPWQNQSATLAAQVKVSELLVEYLRACALNKSSALDSLKPRFLKINPRSNLFLPL